jgi:hypothetical protein
MRRESWRRPRIDRCLRKPDWPRTPSRAGRRLVEPVEHAQQRRLAGSARADHGQDLIGLTSTVTASTRILPPTTRDRLLASSFNPAFGGCGSGLELAPMFRTTTSISRPAELPECATRHGHICHPLSQATAPPARLIFEHHGQGRRLPCSMSSLADSGHPIAADRSARGQHAQFHPIRIRSRALETDSRAAAQGYTTAAMTLIKFGRQLS